MLLGQHGRRISLSPRRVQAPGPAKCAPTASIQNPRDATRTDTGLPPASDGACAGPEPVARIDRGRHGGCDRIACHTDGLWAGAPATTCPFHLAPDRTSPTGARGCRMPVARMTLALMSVYGWRGRRCGEQLVRLSGESSNAFFEVLEDWEAQLKPHEALLPEMEP